MTEFLSNLQKPKKLLLAVSSCGIIIPDSAKEKPLKGVVKAVGHGTKDEEMVVKAGDTVLYGKYAGTEIEVDGAKLLMMRQSDILAIVEE